MARTEAEDPVAAIRLLNPALQPEAATASHALSLLMLEPQTEAYLRVEAANDDQPAPDEPFPYLVPGTRIFINSAVARDLRADVLTAAAVWAASGSTSLSTGAALLRKLLATVKLLDEESFDLFLVVTTASARRGGRPATWADIVATYDGNADGLQERLGKLVRRKVLADSPDGWTVTP
jgi:hypothetical protein